MSNEQMEFKIGEDENPAEVELGEDGKAEVVNQDPPPAVETSASQQNDEELENYSEKVKKRIDKMTARLREAQRREEAALEYAKNVQAQLQAAHQNVIRSDTDRLSEAKSRVETQSVALKQIIRKAREEGDLETEMEAQERLAAIVLEQKQIQAAEAQRASYAQQRQQPIQPQQLQYQQPVVQQQKPKPRPDPRAEEWAEKNEWYGQDMVMTMAAQGIHMELIQSEGIDPNSDEYYDELNRRIRETFPNKFPSSQSSRSPRPAQAVAPANRSSGINNARRTVRLTPSQVAIAKKLGVPLEEYAKYVKE
jgi:hypothetical protein